MSALERLYRSHESRVRRAVRCAVRGVDPAVIEDACQDAWLTALRNADRIRADAEEGLYAYVVTCAIRRGRRLATSRRRTVELTDAQPSVVDVEALAIIRETLSLAAASDRQRRLLWLFALGFSYAEISAITGVTPRTLDRQLQRGRRALRA